MKSLLTFCCPFFFLPAFAQDLGERARLNQDSTAWNRELLARDLVNYREYAHWLAVLPHNCTAFPVADYDWAVSSREAVFHSGSTEFAGLILGEYVHPDDTVSTNRLGIFCLRDTVPAEVMVQSRNYPYLTAQGLFFARNQQLDFVAVSAPDGTGYVLVNMKLFDLRYGRTIVLHPRHDGSFRYRQLEADPGNFASPDLYVREVERLYNGSPSVQPKEKE